MISLDANVVVRLITNDDPRQAARARAMIVLEPASIQDSVVLEVAWVLRSVYRYSEKQILKALRIIAETRGITVANEKQLLAALDGADAGLDFEDAFHIASCAEPRFATFDSRLRKRATHLFDRPEIISP